MEAARSNSTWDINLVRKLIKVIESMKNETHILGTRRYIDLYYKQYGERNRGIIELYFNKTIKVLKNN